MVPKVLPSPRHKLDIQCLPPLCPRKRSIRQPDNYDAPGTREPLLHVSWQLVRPCGSGLKNKTHIPCRASRIQQSWSTDPLNTACAACTRCASPRPGGLLAEPPCATSRGRSSNTWYPSCGSPQLWSTDPQNKLCVVCTQQPYARQTHSMSELLCATFL